MVITMHGDGTPGAVYDLADGAATPGMPTPLIAIQWDGTRVVPERPGARG